MVNGYRLAAHPVPQHTKLRRDKQGVGDQSPSSDHALSRLGLPPVFKVLPRDLVAVEGSHTKTRLRREAGTAPPPSTDGPTGDESCVSPANQLIDVEMALQYEHEIVPFECF